MANNVLQKPNGEILIYQAEDGTTKISVRFENENVWHSLVPPLLNRAGTFMKEMNYSRFQLVRFFLQVQFYA